MLHYNTISIMLMEGSHSVWINVEIEQSSIFFKNRHICELATSFHHANNMVSSDLREM